MTTKSRTTLKYSKKSLADIATDLIDACDKTQREIALEMGYDKPNVISMMKKGYMPIPLNKVALLAKAVGADPIYLLERALLEYYPAIHEALTGVLGTLVTKHEQELIEMIRAETGGEAMRFSKAGVKALIDRSK
jgi:hypothetical protein